MLFDDKDNPTLVKKRKYMLIFVYIVIYIIFAINILLVTFLVYEKCTLIDCFLICLEVFIMLILLHHVFIKDSVNKYKYGIELNNKELNVFGKKILVESISYAKVINFQYYYKSIYLAIIYSDKIKRNRMKRMLILKNNTNNILLLCNLIRQIKSWPEQCEIEKWSYSKWKRHVAKD